MLSRVILLVLLVVVIVAADVVVDVDVVVAVMDAVAILIQVSCSCGCILSCNCVDGGIVWNGLDGGGGGGGGAGGDKVNKFKDIRLVTWGVSRIEVSESTSICLCYTVAPIITPITANKNASYLPPDTTTIIARAPPPILTLNSTRTPT